MAKSAGKSARSRSAGAELTEVKPAAGAGISLDDILGQDKAIATLRKAMTGGRLHHAFIFHGPTGVGKFTAACAFGRALLDPGDGSAAAAQAQSGVHPDLHIVRKELAAHSRDDRTRKSKQTNLAVEVLREFVLEPAAMAASLGGAGTRANKVFVIDEAELIDPVGQNALLKTLEEPPPGTVIILVTSALDRLLITVRSRCQSVAFAPLDARSMAKWMEKSNVGGSAEERSWLLWLADGSPGLAQLGAQRGLHAWQGTIGALLSRSEAGRYEPALGPEMAKLVDEQVAAAIKAAPDASKESANRLWARHMLAYVARTLRDGVRQPARQARALRGLEVLHDAERAIQANVRIADVMENISVQMAAQ